ncbi:iron-sulfur cluster repair di-iron protein [Clostridium botulinum]|uniref:iron-sulfur cluster repair di-iron protein n=1 Tax=unclassified Clostridium TaxID=2614128 RepID=UPI000508B612|nr:MULTISPECIES: iron-sulfur cluster repair di-iron protein [unclassified Clostridium]AIY81688.1 iron-sulfur cluster repair di-iron protein [Clostridium botulinum 202F]KAI3345123.1 iron-sulfur cluster repair di-iron protein [Clostridium botulinum]KFX56635.1 ScdA [Clostridium botulinum]KON11939.1 ScdA [Clostridium botulinum]MBY6777885.1 iron-sulfur cluster repair di-iron protein [Clostridium botulinum]
MNKFNSNQKIGDIVTKFPKVADIFKEYKIDFCCGGDRTLITAIKEQGVNETELLERINDSYEKLKNNIYSKDRNWVEAPLDELVDQIVNVHHAYLYENLPKISELIIKILRVHGEKHPELSRVHKLFHTIKMELEAHLIEEETIQYPSINAYLRSNSETDLDKAINIINQLQDEHIGAGNILKELREITNDYDIPSNVCTTYRLTYSKLQEMESDMFQHIHLESNILFPRLYELKK